ncbi:hypothetical protein KZZ52_31910 [Dactylosporangium sp. AC04546]|uniref:hypothetical protein n=1 Tax=Dactylosporangium sp. AC04546 TaxID=2862460 RepID=UPI001EDCA008|nr:hypothetical protein [Dactylosporangium sp. AC04546]WVK78598.1 hypothetical protein KZZ52_31910 [Dactylosporangium sp. AC04546]
MSHLASSGIESSGYAPPASGPRSPERLCPPGGPPGPEGIDIGAVHAFGHDRLASAREAALADEVAALIGQPKAPCTPIASAVRQVMEHVGGDAELLDWLDGFPGRPRLVTRVLTLVALLDRFGDRLPVVWALQDLRTRAPDPPLLAAHLPDVIGQEALSALGGQIKMMLGEDDLAPAGRLALATAGLLTDLAPHVAEVPGIEELGTLAERSRTGLNEALAAVEAA